MYSPEAASPDRNIAVLAPVSPVRHMTLHYASGRTPSLPRSARVAAFARWAWRFVLVACATVNEACADINIAPYAIIKSTPYVGASTAYLVDGRTQAGDDNTLMMAAPLPIRIGAPMPVQYEFIFQRRAPVTKVRIFQHATSGRRPASGYVIELDVAGTGAYEKAVANEQQGRGGQWAEYTLSPPIAAYALRFRTTAFPSGPGPNYGAPAIGELEIYADAAPSVSATPSMPAAPDLTADTASSKPLNAGYSTLPWRDQFERGVVGSMWLFWSPGIPYSERRNAKTFELLRRLRVNRYWLNPGVYVPNNKDLPYLTLPKDPGYRYFIDRQFADRDKARAREMRILPFPSTVLPGYKEDVLTSFVEDMHNHNIGVIVNEFPLRFGLGSWDFPRVMDSKEYPCILSSSFVRDASTALYREFMRTGIDGLALGGDEFFVHAHTGEGEESSPVCRNSNGVVNDRCTPTCGDLFRRKFGFEPAPSEKSFSPRKARWKAFEYEQLASLFAGYAEMMTSVNPQAVVTSLFRAGEENRPAYGIAYDVMGSTGRVSVISSNPYWSHDSYLGHYYFANETKKLIGASRDRTAVITLQPTPSFNKNGYANPLMLYGPALSALMHGVRGINFYEQRYIFAGGKNDAGPTIEKIFNLTAFLEQQGLMHYRTPRSVAVLYSRASEDWWQLAHASNPLQAAEGILYQNAVMEVLFRNGVPFDLYYVDQPATLDELGNYALAILPYPYSVGTEAGAKIRNAIGKGTAVISLKHRGEVDEFAERRTPPLLDTMPGIADVRVDLSKSSYAELSTQLMGVVANSMPAGLPLTLHANGRDIECSMQQNDSDRLVFCLNWEMEPAEIGLGLSLKEGTYAVSVITLDRQSAGAINGRSALSASDLRNFHLALAPGEAKILSVKLVQTRR